MFLNARPYTIMLSVYVGQPASHVIFFESAQNGRFSRLARFSFFFFFYLTTKYKKKRNMSFSELSIKL